MDDSDGIMTVCSTKSSEDSGFDNGFLSDSSSSSSSPDCLVPVCLFEETSKLKKCSKHSRHNCALDNYNISGKCIENISPRTFLYYANCVRSMNLSHNRIRKLPETISVLKNLEELNLSFNELSHLPDSCNVLKKLRVLNVSQNKLQEPPLCLELGMEQLTYLDLSRNTISKFPNLPKCSPSLQFLNLSHNNLSLLPLWLFSEQCRSMVELDVSFNFCFDDPTLRSQLLQMKHHRTSVLKHLRKLNISNTGSKLELLTLLSSFESLQSLFMGNLNGPETTFNYLWEIPVSLFYNPSSVVELNLSKIGLAGLPDEFPRLENLEVLNVSNNSLDWLPETFGMLKSLRELIMSDCNLCYLPENFNQLRSLKKLVIDHNKLTDIRSSLAGLASLEWLDLYSNNLDELPVAHNHLLTLHMVDMDANYVNLNIVLDIEAHGERLLDVYTRQRERLREVDGRDIPRQDGFRVSSNTISWSSLESLHKSYNSDSDLSQMEAHELGEGFVKAEEENWDEDSCSGNEDFSPDLVPRYYLPPGQFKFGWTPPVKRRECTVPIGLALSGFVYVPGEAHTKTTRRRRRKIHEEPVFDGQFDDFVVDDTAGVQKADALAEFLKRLCMFVRHPEGPVCNRCKFCGVYEDCWHHGFWIRF